MPKPLSHNGLVFLRLQASNYRKTYAGLLYIAKEKGYPYGWVWHKFINIFNGRPKPLSPVEPQEPESDLWEYVATTNRNFRAKKKREEAKNGGSGTNGGKLPRNSVSQWPTGEAREVRLANMGDRVPMRDDNDMGTVGTRCSADGELVGSPLMTAEDWDWVA